MRTFIALLGLVATLLTACDAPQRPRGPQLADTPRSNTPGVVRFAVHPLHNPKKLDQAYRPLIDHLNEQVHGVRFELEASRDYADYETKIRRRTPDFLLPNPWQTLEAIKVGYAVIAMAGQPADFKGLILVRKDSGIREVSDLKGKAVAYPSPTALAACMLPQWYLRANGLDVMKDISNHYVGSQESSILNVYLGQTAAGATWPPPWRAFQKEHPQEAMQLKVAWETEPLINNSVMVRDDVPPQLADGVQRALIKLQSNEQGRAILAGMETERFLPAANADYDVVRRFVAEFESKLRPVEPQRR